MGLPRLKLWEGKRSDKILEAQQAGVTPQHVLAAGKAFAAAWPATKEDTKGAIYLGSES